MSRQEKSIVRSLMVSLRDLYCGTSKKLSVSRNVICSKCSCSGCKGSGVKLVKVYYYGLVVQPCNECRGTGERETMSNNCCPGCKGDKVVQEKKIVEVHVEQGMKNGQMITFPGEGNQAPKTDSGDIVVVLVQWSHPKFQRMGDNLAVEHTLSLTEALSGFQFALTHLDGRKFLIETNPVEIVKPDSYKTVNDEGMPVHKKPDMKGKLEDLRNEEIKIKQAQAPEVYDEDDYMHRAAEMCSQQ
ncbi:hypothetical protein MKW98_025114 [Papaver atlanticum]|uniref:Chaperone DnaJ C-terminal domain-containing protein n=1 Tax=Papaver atlanticum TaxID=357466 RepID=A0AAD4X697_9MAGN|nr:hypothetical protein MKW98_025114 [Papaver atlanticum]